MTEVEPLVHRIADIIRDEPQTAREFQMGKLLDECRSYLRAVQPLAAMYRPELGKALSEPTFKTESFQCVLTADLVRNLGGYHFHSTAIGTDGKWNFKYYISRTHIARCINLRPVMTAILREGCEQIIRWEEKK